MFMNNNQLYILGLAALLILTFIPTGVVTQVTGESLSGQKVFRFRLDYLLHTILFFCLTILQSIARKFPQNSVLGFDYFRIKNIKSDSIDSAKDKLIYSPYFMIMLAVVSELAHYFIPWRGFNQIDMLANFAGFLIAFFLVRLYEKLCKLKLDY